MLIKRSLTIGLTLLITLWLFFELPFFKVKQISITGISLLSHSDINLIVSKWGNISFLNLYLLPTYRNQLYDQFPEINNIQWSWGPDNHVHLHIIEKEPTIMIVNNGKSTLVSQDGTLFKKYNSTKIDSDKMLIIRGISAADFQKKYFKNTNNTPLHTLIDLVQTELSDYEIQLEKQANHWILLHKDTLPFLLGDLSLIPNIKNQLKKLLNQVNQFNQPGQIVRYIDLRVFPKIIVGYE
tara:strand:- start:847 stop:1563 length:717 start_codon:yes stop_codon:yes gene_type:complete